jgi:hypothetical protein
VPPPVTRGASTWATLGLTDAGEACVGGAGVPPWLDHGAVWSNAFAMSWVEPVPWIWLRIDF